MSNRKIEDLDPAFQPIVREVITEAQRNGIYPFLTEGRREPEYQACLFAQGRVAAGRTAEYAGLVVHTVLSADGKSVTVRCGSAVNVVPIRRWQVGLSYIVTKVGPYDSYHTQGLATDWSFRSSLASRDDVIDVLVSGAREAVRQGNPEAAARAYTEIDARYTAFAGIWDKVAPGHRWGHDWNSDGIPNAKDTFDDLPHFEWHPGLTIGDIKRGRRPAVPQQCLVCRAFGCRANHPATPRIDPKCEGVA